LHVATSQIALEPLPGGQTKAGIHAVVVADDTITSRRVLAALEEHDIHAVSGGATLADAMEHAPELSSGAIVVLCCDLSSPAHMTALRHLRKTLRDAGIVVVSLGSSRTRVREALNVGADGLVPEQEIERSLAAVLRAVAVGHVSVPRRMRRCVARPAFSHRERQVLALLTTGLQNREIADRLFLAESTVKSHLASSFDKLGVRSRKEATALVLDPDEGLRALVLEDGFDG
jgi:DNA-binding NarL/FixJ family response regulator